MSKKHNVMSNWDSSMMLGPVPCLIRDCPAELRCKKVLAKAYTNWRFRENQNLYTAHLITHEKRWLKKMWWKDQEQNSLSDNSCQKIICLCNFQSWICINCFVPPKLSDCFPRQLLASQNFNPIETKLNLSST